MSVVARVVAEGRLLLAGLALRGNDLATAFNHLHAAVPHLPAGKRIRTWNRMGSIAMVLGDHEREERSLRQALALDPDRPETLTNWGNFLDRRGDFEQARAAYERALRTSRLPVLLYNYAVMLAPREPGPAIALLVEILDSREPIPDVVILRLLGHVASEHPAHVDEVAGIVERYQAEHGARWDLANQHAILISRAGRLDEARALFEDIFERYPSATDVRYNAGMNEVRAGRFAEARAHFEWVAPPVGSYGTARAWDAEGRTGEAVAAYRRFLAELEREPRQSLSERIFGLAEDLDQERTRAEAYIARHGSSEARIDSADRAQSSTRVQ